MNDPHARTSRPTKNPHPLRFFIAVLTIALAGFALAQDPVRGGTLRIAQVSEISPSPHDLGQSDGPFKWQVFDTLVRLDPDNLEPMPQMAERWEFADDFLTLTFYLREGILFHNGEALGAEDVAANLRRVQDPAAGSRLRGTALTIVGIEIPEERTLVLRFEEPNPSILDFFAQLWIGEPSSLDDTTQAVGTGPFRFVEWLPGTRVVLERFDGYWKEGQPYLDRVEILLLPDEETLVANLQAGAVDMVRLIPLTALETVEADPRFEVRVSDAGSNFYAVGIVTSDPPLDDKLVRQALNHSMNRERFVRVFQRGAGEATCVPWPERSPTYDEEQANACAFDLDKARQLLEQAGYADGFPLTVEISRDITPDMIRFVQMWQQDLATLNIQLTIEELSGPVWRQKKRDAEFAQVWSDLFGNTNREPIVPFLQARPFQRDINPSRFASAEYDRLIGEAETEMDAALRHALVRELTDLLLDEAFINPVTYQPQIWAYTTRLQGIAFTEGDQDLLEGAWLQP